MFYIDDPQLTYRFIFKVNVGKDGFLDWFRHSSRHVGIIPKLNKNIMKNIEKYVINVIINDLESFKNLFFQNDEPDIKTLFRNCESYRLLIVKEESDPKIIVEDGTYLDKKETMKWFIASYGISRVVFSAKKHSLRFNIKADHLQLPHNDWFLPSIQNYSMQVFMY